MAKTVHQFRFYSNSTADSRNEPSGSAFPGIKGFTDGTVFQDYYPILQLGVQTLPGTYLFLNSSTDPIIIGSTGIFELDLANGIEITEMRIDAASLNRISDSPSGYLIIDVIYDKREGGA